MKEKDFVVQYEVKVDTFTCGGAYVKLLRQTDSSELVQLNDRAPYSIMFGPDKCGPNNKVHFIFQYQNPVTKIWEEKHFKDAPPAKSDQKTHLYTLIIRKDNTFDILIDNEVAKSGNLLTSMSPPISPPLEIDDPSDTKPSDWVDVAKIPDPDASKPEDWDEVYLAEGMDLVVEKSLLVIVTSVVLLMSIYFMLPIRDGRESRSGGEGGDWVPAVTSVPAGDSTPSKSEDVARD